MAAALAGLSLDEFLDGNYEHAELLGGEVRPKPVNSLAHTRIERRLVRIFEELYGEGRAESEVSIRIGAEGVIPDVAVLRSDRPELYRGIVAESPLLCVEVLSPSQRPEEMFAKCLRYRDFGVPYCWVVDPDGRRAWEMSATGEFGEVHESFRTPQPLPLASLFE